MTRVREMSAKARRGRIGRANVLHAAHLASSGCHNEQRNIERTCTIALHPATEAKDAHGPSTRREQAEWRAKRWGAGLQSVCICMSAWTCAAAAQTCVQCPQLRARPPPAAPLLLQAQCDEATVWEVKPLLQELPQREGQPVMASAAAAAACCRQWQWQACPSAARTRSPPTASQRRCPD